MLCYSTDINEAFVSKSNVAAAFCDIAKAFDTVWHNGLRYRLTQLGLPAAAVRFLSNYLEGRSISVQIGNSRTTPFQPTSGVPQGGVLSATLFLIYMASCPRPVTPSTKISQYADDTALWTTEKCPQKAAALLQTALLELADWCGKWKIRLNPDKTQIILFTKRRVKPTHLPTITLAGTPLAWSSSVKFLGIYFDKRLTWSDHVKHLITKNWLKLNQLRRISNITHLSSNSLLRLYLQQARPSLLYGHEIFFRTWQTTTEQNSKRHRPAVYELAYVTRNTSEATLCNVTPSASHLLSTTPLL